MSNEHDLHPGAATAVLDDLHAKAGELPAVDLVDLEAKRVAATNAMLRDLRREDARKRWDLACPDRLKTSDWAHPRLAPYLPQINRVLGYQIGTRGLLASGPTGRGKTRSMWQLMRRLGIDDGLDVRYWTASDWFTTLQNQITYGRDDARGWVEAVASRHVVFIDDLGQEAIQTNREDWASGWFFRFLDIRVGLGLPLFITTNLTAREIAGRNAGVRANPLVRRLLDLCDPVTFETAAEKSDREAHEVRPRYRADIDG